MSVKRYSGKGIKMKLYKINYIDIILLVTLYFCSIAISGCSVQKDISVKDGQSIGPANVSTSSKASTSITNQQTRSCIGELGLEKAKALVRTCLELSPATHPPCNVENSCSIIRAEIKRSCDYLKQGEQALYDKQCD